MNVENFKQPLIGVLKKAVLLGYAFLLPFSLVAQDAETEPETKSSYSKAGESDVPAQKRPKSPDSSKVKDLDNTDPEGREKNAGILKFGLEDEISELLAKLTTNKDVRFVNEAYDLFEETKSSRIKVNIFEYFAALEDPCLEDYAVMILNDPYDEQKSVVNACFGYVQAVKTSCAIPAVESLLENDAESYFNGAIAALGKIGGSDEALYLTEYFEKEDLTVAQKQTLVRVLGELKATETYDKLVEMAEDENENSFVRMYASEAIGAMQKDGALDVLTGLYDDKDPNLRVYVVKGVANFNNSDAEKLIIQATRDSHVKVRLEAIAAIKKMKFSNAVPYLIYRAKNDPEQAVKNACYPVIAALNTGEGNDYLVGQLTDKKVGDGTKVKISSALLEAGNAGTKEIIDLARESLSDDKRKPMRYALGKEFAKYDNSAFADICLEYLANKDVATQGTGLDIYAKGRYSKADSAVNAIADKFDPEAKKGNANAKKASKILGRSLEKKSE